VVLSVALTTIAAPLIGLGWEVGLVVAAGAMIGDLLSSFVKRRLGMSSSSKFTGLDQIPEALIPLVACMALLPLSRSSRSAPRCFRWGIVLSRVFFKRSATPY
jgi:CDP-2,3-bis-(O-geranylgeranyl)-sn-glycerol synthase